MFSNLSYFNRNKEIMKKYFFLAYILSLFSCTPDTEINTAITLFEGGTEGYACFRIPAIISSGKTILAFAEGRIGGCSDTGNIDLVLKRSVDGGKSWSDLQVVWDPGDNVAGNPAPVFDEATKTVFLLSTWNLGTDHEGQIIAGTSEDTRRVFVLKSTDMGKTWSGAKEITETTKQENWTWYATGPVHGIQVKYGTYKGRLLIPCDHIEADTKHYYSHVIFSDDHGKSWQLGGTTQQHQVNECTIAELPDGKLILNMRNYDRSKRTRKICFSKDGGKTWSDIVSDPGLPEPICQAALISHIPKKGKSVLYFTNPSSENSRQNMSLKISYDGAKSWADSLVLHSGPSAYSDITLLNKGKVGCLYEAGEESPYEGIVFEIVELK